MLMVRGVSTCPHESRIDVTFSSRSVQKLQNFLKLGGVLITWQRKLDLVRLCQAAHEISIEIDPDGFLVEREEVIQLWSETCNSSYSHIYLLTPFGYWGTMNNNTFYRFVSFKVIFGVEKH